MSSHARNATPLMEWSGRAPAPPGLILAIARAKRWMQGLCDGRYQHTAEIARRFKLNEVLFADVKNTGVTEMIMPSSTTGNSGRPAVILSRYSRALARRGA